MEFKFAPQHETAIRRAWDGRNPLTLARVTIEIFSSDEDKLKYALHISSLASDSIFLGNPRISIEDYFRELRCILLRDKRIRTAFYQENHIEVYRLINSFGMETSTETNYLPASR